MPLRDRLADAALVIRIGEAVQKADRDCLNLLRGQSIDSALAMLASSSGIRTLALCVDALADRQPQAGAAPAAAADRC